MKINIDTTNGELSAGSPPLTVHPSLSLSAFLESDLGQRSEKVNTRRYVYSLWHPLGDDFLLGAVLSFHSDGFITSMRLKIGTAKEKSEGVWSREMEDKIKERHDAWLMDQVGSTQHHFPWGMISSIIDMHGYSSVVIVVYRQIDSEAYYGARRVALEKIVGSQITSIKPSESQLILGMGERGELLTRVLPDLIKGKETITHDMEIYEDELGSFVGHAPNSVVMNKTEEIIMAFDEGKELRIALSKYKGRNERMILTGPRDYRFIF